MKKISLILAAIVFCTIEIFAGDIPVKSKISNVTIFPSSAQVTRIASFNSANGSNEIIFDNVSPYLNVSSIQAKGKGNFTILDVKFRFKQPEIVLENETEISPKILRDIALLEDSLVYINFDMADLVAQMDAFTLEKSILLNNQLVKGNGGDTITELKATMEYFRLRIADINSQLQKLKKQQFELNKKVTRMNTRLSDLRAYNNQKNPIIGNKNPIPQIVVIISSDASITAGSLEISYMVSNAGWSPSYDLKTIGIDQPVQLIYKADVWQNTGEDWESVKVRLSTITPSANNVKPILPSFYLYYYTYQAASSYSTREKRDESKSYNAESNSAPGSVSQTMTDSDYAYNYTSAVQTMTNVEFEIKLPYTIPSDAQVHILPIQNESIPTTYVYYIVPKMESQAFLIAKLTDWQKLDLLPGKANIYFDGTFVGETEINPSTISDTLDLALGRDRSLQIQRKQLKNETVNKLIGSICTKTITYEITVKNTKMVKTDIVIQDIIPLSNSEDIKVVLTDKGKALHYETTGLLQWSEKLGAGETKKYTYTYTVEYDSSKQLNFNF